MKKDIHPKYGKCLVRCGCGATWETQSTIKEIKVEICSSCHPFYTGSGGKLVDTLGRVDRFQKKFGDDYFSRAKQQKKPKLQRR